MTDKYAVIGNPITHSKSPAIHAAFAKQTNQTMTYEATLAPLGGFSDTVAKLIAEGYQGVNVTVPFKLDAFELATELDALAQHAGAVNTLSFNQGVVHGYNTDGLGMVRDIEENLKTPLAGKRILLLGAGGAAQGVLYPLLDKAPSELVVANRTVEKAVAMIDKVSSDYSMVGLAPSTYESLSQPFDVVINATSTGLNKTSLPIADIIFAESCLAYDMMYGRETPFMKQARANNASVADGLGMLVEQAAEAFTLWRGVRPNSKAVIDQMSVV